MSIIIEIFISEEKLYFSHYPCEILHPGDVAFTKDADENVVNLKSVI